jgi:hypothetical protein
MIETDSRAPFAAGFTEPIRQLIVSTSVFCVQDRDIKEMTMAGVVLWLLGVPLVVILLLYLVF